MCKVFKNDYLGSCCALTPLSSNARPSCLFATPLLFNSSANEFIIEFESDNDVFQLNDPKLIIFENDFIVHKLYDYINKFYTRECVT